MGSQTTIGWCDKTFNPWMGCSKVSEGCANCYAEELMDHHYKKVRWGPGKPRRLTSDKNWRDVERWNKEAEEAGIRFRVFCASLADVFDDEVPNEWRRRLFKLIGRTPHLDWLLLTKRPQNIMLLTRRAIDPFDDPELEFNIAGEPNGLEVATFAELYPHVHLGVSIENQHWAEVRLAELRKIECAYKFASIEPQLGPIDLIGTAERPGPGVREEGFKYHTDYGAGEEWCSELVPILDQVIVGGESGAKRRDFEVSWAADLRDQCKRLGVAFFMKQDAAFHPGQQGRIPLDLWNVKEFPEVRLA